MDYKTLAKKVYDISYLTGEFLLRSGQTSSHYFDKYRFEANPNLLKEIAKHLAPKIPKDTEVLAGLEMGGIPIATALSLQSQIPAAFVRKEAKPYGTCQLAEGSHIEGKKLLLIEDVITTGGQVVESTKELRQRGAIVENVICVIYRGEGPCDPLDDIGLSLQPLFTMKDLTNYTQSD